MSEQIHRMFSAIAPHYDRTNEILSFGIHRRWRSAAVAFANPLPGQRILDCATGTGDLALAFHAALGTDGEVVATDFNPDMLAIARTKAVGTPIHFELADATALPFPDASFDSASIAFGIRNVDDPRRCLTELARVVKPGGSVLILEFGQPSGPFGLAFRLYSRWVIPLLGRLLTGSRGAYEYLPRTAAAFPAGEAFLDLMRGTGAFLNLERRRLTFGLAYLYRGQTLSK